MISCRNQILQNNIPRWIDQWGYGFMFQIAGDSFLVGESAQYFLVKQTPFRSICLFVCVGSMQVSADVTSGGYGSEGAVCYIWVSRQDHKSAVVTIVR